MADGPFSDDAPEARLQWIRVHLDELGRVPRPGGGSTQSRFRTLAGLGRLDGSLGRLAEGHLDALAILDELDGGTAVEAGVVRGVWAARPDAVTACRRAGGWHLTGRKPWCSGADGLDQALLTAHDGAGRARLFDVDTADLRFEDDWHPLGMRATASRTAVVDVRVADDRLVGDPGSYVARPGFGHGGIGVAAVWHGLAQRVAADLASLARERDDPYTRAAAGGAVAVLAAGGALLDSAARLIDDGPCDVDAACRRATLVRVAVERGARDVLQASVVAQGAAALCFDQSHARAVADLTVYLGQLHHGSDAAAIDAADAMAWWP